MFFSWLICYGSLYEYKQQVQALSRVLRTQPDCVHTASQKRATQTQVYCEKTTLKSPKLMYSLVKLNSTVIKEQDSNPTQQCASPPPPPYISAKSKANNKPPLFVFFAIKRV